MSQSLSSKPCAGPSSRALEAIRAGDGRYLWSERYDHKLDDLLELQQDIAQSIVASLSERLLGMPLRSRAYLADS